MARNLIIAVSSAAILALLFVGYWKLTYVPPPGPATGPATTVEIPPASRPGRDVFRVGGEELVAEIAPGRRMAITLYDERSGQATDRLVFDDWRRVPGSEDEILVEKPELSLLLPSGGSATIQARQAQITVSGLRGEHIRPRHGWFEGDVRLTLSRGNGDGAVTLTMPRMDFDLDLGQMRTDGRVRAAGNGVEIEAEGLNFVWNQAENRIEQLTLRHGRRLAIELTGSPLAPAPQTASPTRAAQAAPPADRERRTGYRCVLSDRVRVEQRRGDAVEASLTGDRLELIFDVGGRNPLRPATAASAPASAAATPTSRPTARLVVQWSGPLTLEPVPPADGPPRQEVIATGSPLVLESPDGRIVCAALHYADQDQRLWLRPAAGAQVELTRSDGSRMTADSVYLDRGRRLIVLAGDVRLAARGEQDQRLTVRCSQYAELLLSAPTGNMPRPVAAPLPAAQIERASFVGDVHAAVGLQRVRCSNLVVRFARDGATTTRPASRVSQIVARGTVRLEQRYETGHPLWLELLREDARRLATYLVHGRLPAGRLAASLRCDWLRADLTARDGRSVPQRIEAIGGVVLRDPRRGVRARAAELRARFAAGEIEQAELLGRPGAPALLRAEPYHVRGPQIALSGTRQTLTVPRSASLRFAARRNLRGEAGARRRWITVRCDGTLRIVGDAGPKHDAVVELNDNVVATAGNERLHARKLTLWIETLKRQPAAGPRQDLRSVLARLRPRVAGRSEDRPVGWVDWENPAADVRREPSLLVAWDVVLVSEQRTPGRSEPLVEQSIVAPELRADLRARRFRTVGVTQLFMIDRRGRPRPRGESPDPSAPSSLISSGPSQTAMQCNGSLLYVLGEPGPDRRDLAFLEGGVIFRRVSGRAMVGWEQMLPPDVAGDPKKREKLTGIPSRNTWLECDRLEAAFGYRARRGPELVWLNARQRVYLRDQTESKVRSIYAEQIQFDRLAGIIRVLGDPQRKIDARIYDEDPATGRFSMPAAGPVLIVDLRNNAIRSGPIRGMATGG